MVAEPKTMRDRPRHAERVMPCILERGFENPIGTASRDGTMPKRFGMTLEVKPDGQVDKAEWSKMTTEEFVRDKLVRKRMRWWERPHQRIWDDRRDSAELTKEDKKNYIQDARDGEKERDGERNRNKEREPQDANNGDGMRREAKMMKPNVFGITLQDIIRWGEMIVGKRKLDEDLGYGARTIQTRATRRGKRAETHRRTLPVE